MTIHLANLVVVAVPILAAAGAILRCEAEFYGSASVIRGWGDVRTQNCSSTCPRLSKLISPRFHIDPKKCERIAKIRNRVSTTQATPGGLERPPSWLGCPTRAPWQGQMGSSICSERLVTRCRRRLERSLRAPQQSLEKSISRDTAKP